MRRSSFARKGAVSGADLGTRPGPYSQTLVSSGHAELDRLLGGGLPLGSLTLILEDGTSRHHATLLRYFLAEGAACGQAVALAAAAAPPGGLTQFIPQQLQRGSAAAKEDEREAEEEGEGKYALRIAWQYRRYLQPQGAGRPQPHSSAARGAEGGDGTAAAAAAAAPPPAPAMGAEAGRGGAGSSGGRRVRIEAPAPDAGGPGGRLRDWCHQFDLSKGLGEEALARSRAALIDCRSEQPTASLASGAAAFWQLLEQAAGGSPAGSGPEQAGQQSTEKVAPSSQEQPPLGAAAAEVGAAVQPAAGAPVANAGEAPCVWPRAALPLLTAPPLRSAQHVGRLAVLSLGSPEWWASQGAAGPGGGSSRSSWGGLCSTAPGEPLGTDPSPAPEAQALRALLQLKAGVRERRCAAVVSVPAALLSAAGVARMAHLADCVLALEGVADDSDIVKLAPDAASVAGLLHLRKLPALGALAPPMPEVALFLIRNKRRRLAITPIEIDPDAEAGLAEGQGSSGSGGATAASLLCGGLPKAEASALDF